MTCVYSVTCSPKIQPMHKMMSLSTTKNYHIGLVIEYLRYYDTVGSQILII